MLDAYWSRQFLRYAYIAMSICARWLSPCPDLFFYQQLPLSLSIKFLQSNATIACILILEETDLFTKNIVCKKNEVRINMQIKN